ncbi:MAG: hypothetical protein R3338_00070 [Thermoanaerobaculia bacterium]|nr:hypothetical protein [Thermoanaerobaculia bacterium]
MRFVRVVPAVLSVILLAAHFLRAGNLWLVALVLASPLILLIRHPAAVRALQVLLAVGFVEWLYTTWVLASMRDAAGMPWGRMLVILGGVALFTLFSAILLERTARDRKPRAA